MSLKKKIKDKRLSLHRIEVEVTAASTRKARTKMYRKRRGDREIGHNQDQDPKGGINQKRGHSGIEKRIERTVIELIGMVIRRSGRTVVREGRQVSQAG